MDALKSLLHTCHICFLMCFLMMTGLLTGSVPMQDFKLAVSVLEKAVSQITTACDPDEPLDPSEWGMLPEQPITNEVEKTELLAVNDDEEDESINVDELEIDDD